MAGAVGGAGGRALEAAAGAVAAVEDQMVRSPAASSNLPMVRNASAAHVEEDGGAAEAEVAAAEAEESPEATFWVIPRQLSDILPFR